LFSRYLNQEHFKVATFLPMHSCLRQDSTGLGSIVGFLKGSYLQPELRAERHVWPDSLSEVEKEALQKLNKQVEQASEKAGETQDEAERKRSETSESGNVPVDVEQSVSETDEPGNTPEEETRSVEFDKFVDSLVFW
jgi:hypothetical protein